MRRAVESLVRGPRSRGEREERAARAVGPSGVSGRASALGELTSGALGRCRSGRKRTGPVRGRRAAREGREDVVAQLGRRAGALGQGEGGKLGLRGKRFGLGFGPVWIGFRVLGCCAREVAALTCGARTTGGKTRAHGRRLSGKARGSGLRWSGPDAGERGSGVLGRAGPTEEERADRAG